jgi:DNA-binding winged helix-turn-helix (wHTH) protein/tetratricopeptide (TPR) repeat protein
VPAQNPDKVLTVESRPAGGSYLFGAYRFDLMGRALFKGSNRLALTPKAVETLRVLLEHAGNLVTTEQLMREVWPASFVEPGSITRNIADLRKALGDRGHIETISKRGYRFVTTVQHSRAEEPQAILRIGIQPFELLIHDSALHHLRVGIATALAAKLSAVPGCVAHILTEEAGVDTGGDSAVHVRGTIQPSDGVIRVGIAILDPQKSAPVWSETLEYGLDQPLAIEDACAEEFAGAVALWIAKRQRKLLAKRYTKSSQAYKFYLAGHYHLGRRSRAAVEKAIACFRQSVESDPEYAMAFAGLAASYALLAMLGPVDAAKYMPKARIAALNALEGDETLAEARSALAFVKWHYEWDWRGAESEFRRILKFYPNDALTRQWLGLMLVEQGHFAEAIKQAARAHKLEPKSVAIRANLATVLMLAGRGKHAADEAREALRLDPNSQRAQWVLGGVLQADGQHEVAIELLEAAFIRAPDSPMLCGSLVYCYAKHDRKDRALDLLRRIEEHSDQNAWAYARGLAYLGLGRAPEALECFAQAQAGHNFQIILLKVDRRLDEIRGHPRFRSIAKAVGLEG